MTALPHKATVKLMSLQGQATDARDAALSAQRRTEEIRQSLRYSDNEPANADELKAELDRLEKVKLRMNEKSGAIGSLVAGINLYLRRNPSLQFNFDPFPQKPKLEGGETVLVALGRLRDQITALRSHIGVIKTAPMPPDALKKTMREHVDKLAERGRPQIQAQGGQFKLSFSNPINPHYAMSPQVVLEMMAYLMRDQLVKQLERDIDRLPKHEHAMQPLQKAKRILELESELDKAERAEELLIQQAEGDGIEVLRRTDASPLAVLGLTIKRPAKVKEVA